MLAEHRDRRTSAAIEGFDRLVEMVAGTNADKSAASDTSNCERRRRSRHRFTNIPTVSSELTVMAVTTATMPPNGAGGNHL